MRLAQTSSAIDELAGEDYAALFMPGGHGTMWDYPGNIKLAEMIVSAAEQGKVVASVCHGPACLTGVTILNGRPFVEGRRVTGFTNTEEEAVGLAKTVPFLLENRLKDLGVEFERGEDWQPFAVSVVPLSLGTTAPTLAQPCSQQQTDPQGDNRGSDRVLPDDRLSGVHAPLALVSELIGRPVGATARMRTRRIGNIAPQGIAGSHRRPGGNSATPVCGLTGRLRRRGRSPDLLGAALQHLFGGWPVCLGDGRRRLVSLGRIGFAGRCRRSCRSG